MVVFRGGSTLTSAATSLHVPIRGSPAISEIALINALKSRLGMILLPFDSANGTAGFPKHVALKLTVQDACPE
jgi:hypothetical protein